MTAERLDVAETAIKEFLRQDLNNNFDRHSEWTKDGGGQGFAVLVIAPDDNLVYRGIHFRATGHYDGIQPAGPKATKPANIKAAQPQELAQLNAQLSKRLKTVLAELKSAPEHKDPRKSSWGVLPATYDDLEPRGIESRQCRPVAFKAAPRGIYAAGVSTSKGPKHSEDVPPTEPLPDEDEARSLAKALRNQVDFESSNPHVRKRRRDQADNTSNTQPSNKPQSTVEPRGGVEIVVDPDPEADGTKRARTPSLGVTPAQKNDIPWWTAIPLQYKNPAADSLSLRQCWTPTLSSCERPSLRRPGSDLRA